MLMPCLPFLSYPPPPPLSVYKYIYIYGGFLRFYPELRFICAKIRAGTQIPRFLIMQTFYALSMLSFNCQECTSSMCHPPKEPNKNMNKQKIKSRHASLSVATLFIANERDSGNAASHQKKVDEEMQSFIKAELSLAPVDTSLLWYSE